jgi:hypothetical protein
MTATPDELVQKYCGVHTRLEDISHIPGKDWVHKMTITDTALNKIVFKKNYNILVLPWAIKTLYSLQEILTN